MSHETDYSELRVYLLNVSTYDETNRKLSEIKNVNFIKKQKTLSISTNFS